MHCDVGSWPDSESPILVRWVRSLGSSSRVRGTPETARLTRTCHRLCIAAVPPRPFRDCCDSSASSENRQWIERRSCSFFDAQRRSREQKLETIKPPRLLDRSLEIEIIENVYAHRDQRQPMQRIWDRCRQTCGRDVVWPVASDEGNAPLFRRDSPSRGTTRSHHRLRPASGSRW